MSTTIKAVTARKRRRCDAEYRDVHIIAPGHRYLRHVAFPDEDYNSSGRPWVMTECVACAATRELSTGVVLGACLTWCCGDVPCARPFGHRDDHSCICCVR